MNYTKLQDELLLVVDDDSQDITERRGEFINEACGLIAEQLEPPGLKEPFTVTTVESTAYATLPVNFSGKLTYAGLLGGELAIENGLEILYRKYPSLDDIGGLGCVAVEGSKLYYYPIPAAATTIYCVGYMLPDTLVNGSDTPLWCPEYLHREVIVYKAAEIAWNLIEDGIDRAKANTILYGNLNKIGINKFREWVHRRSERVTKAKYYV
jgi:hypothetical protein